MCKKVLVFALLLCFLLPFMPLKVQASGSSFSSSVLLTTEQTLET